MGLVLIDITGARAAVRKQDVLTVGMVGAQAEFRFCDGWDSLGKIAVFRQGNVTKDAVIYDGVATIPWEVLQLPGIPVSVGVYGTNGDGTIVIPTVWTRTAPVHPGADPSGDESADPSLPLWAQLAAQIEALKAGGGMSVAAANLLLTILRNGVYTSDQSANIDALEAALESGENEPDEPVVPDVPEADVSQTGSILSIVSGVTASQSGAVLEIA